MTEYEIATLAIREAALWATWAQVTAALAIGLGQIAIVAIGIRSMQRAGERRAKEQDQRHAEAMRSQDQRHAEAMHSQDQRHAEAMQRHAEAMQRHTEAMQRLDIQTRALETLISRTAPAGPPEAPP